MPTHQEKRRVRYSAQQMFDLVADVERYPDFLPWCQVVKIQQREGNVIVSLMVIGYKLFSERFFTRTALERPDRIDIAYEKGPFRYLNSQWAFHPLDDGGCEIEFFIDFEFRSALLGRALKVVFTDATKVMVRAFERRARHIYGRPGAVPSVQS